MSVGTHRKPHDTRSENIPERRDFPRFRKCQRPYCPKHQRAMMSRKERAPTFAMGGFKHGQRTVYFCPILGCPFVTVGISECYRGESIAELGSLEGV
jgi:hypothetical protein